VLRGGTTVLQVVIECFEVVEECLKVFIGGYRVF